MPWCWHGSSEHRDAIRFHRLQHLNDRINIDPQVMRANCRYKSDISTPPPLHRVALTLDDGPEPGQTELILCVLARYNIRATFFMIGEKAKRRRCAKSCCTASMARIHGHMDRHTTHSSVPCLVCKICGYGGRG